MIYACANLNWSLPAPHQRGQLAIIREEADVIAACEMIVEGKAREWKVNRPSQEALLWRATVAVLRTGAKVAAWHRRGVRIRRRRFVWADVEDPDLDRVVRVVVAHMPTRRGGAHRILGPIYAARLRDLLGHSPHPWIVGGDWNQRLTDDPAKLHAKFGAVWYGQRIDGWAVHRKLADDVADMRPVLDPDRRDAHPVVYLTLRRP